MKNFQKFISLFLLVVISTGIIEYTRNYKTYKYKDGGEYIKSLYVGEKEINLTGGNLVNISSNAERANIKVAVADGWQVDKVCYSVNHQEAKSIYDDENAELIQIANGGEVNLNTVDGTYIYIYLKSVSSKNKAKLNMYVEPYDLISLEPLDNLTIGDTVYIEWNKTDGGEGRKGRCAFVYSDSYSPNESFSDTKEFLKLLYNFTPITANADIITDDEGTSYVPVYDYDGIKTVKIKRNINCRVYTVIGGKELQFEVLYE